jgi:hypothetical protein
MDWPAANIEHYPTRAGSCLDSDSLKCKQVVVRFHDDQRHDWHHFDANRRWSESVDYRHAGIILSDDSIRADNHRPVDGGRWTDSGQAKKTGIPNDPESGELPILWISLQTRGSIALGIVFLMTVKRVLVGSLLVIGVAIMLGIASVLPLLRRERAQPGMTD